MIAATNRTLRKAMGGRFQEMYRLNLNIVVRAAVATSCRSVKAFLDEFDVVRAPPAGLPRCERRPARSAGCNVRELRNALERAAIVCEGGLITAAHLSLPRDTPEPAASAPTTDLTTVERDLISRVMQECAGNKSRAAQRLGLTRAQLYVRLRKFRLE